MRGIDLCPSTFDIHMSHRASQAGRRAPSFGVSFFFVVRRSREKPCLSFFPTPMEEFFVKLGVVPKMCEPA
jgi:hypothetical protein